MWCEEQWNRFCSVRLLLWNPNSNQFNGINNCFFFRFIRKVQWPIFGHESFIYCLMPDDEYLTIGVICSHQITTMQPKVYLQFNNNNNNNDTNCITFISPLKISSMKLVTQQLYENTIFCISLSSLVSWFRWVWLCSIKLYN